MTARPSLSLTRDCNRVLRQLKDDHAFVKRSYQRFRQLDPHSDREEFESVVRATVQALDVHAMLEEEWLYPQARDALNDPDLVNEAEVEHASMRRLIEQLQSMSADEDKFGARFAVLCEYALHHAQEEEGKLFPALHHRALDWFSICRHMDQRREVLAMNGADVRLAQADAASPGYAGRGPPSRELPGPAAYRVPAVKA